MNKKTTKIEFAPGCFDNFEGTQEELDALIAEIQQLADSGELAERATVVDLNDLDDEAMDIIEEFFGDELAKAQRKLQ